MGSPEVPRSGRASNDGVGKMSRLSINGSAGTHGPANASSTSSFATASNCRPSATTRNSGRSRRATRAWSRWTGSSSGPVRHDGDADGMEVVDKTPPPASAAQREAFDRILANHMLYCTVCDNNNGNCTIHNTTKMLAVEHQAIPFTAEALRGRQHQPLLSLRSRPVHALRPLRRGMPECRGQRDPLDQLGRRASPRALGRRLDDRRIELRLVRPLRHGLPVQRPDGEVDARPRRLPDGPAEAGARRA